ncbi:MAG TPA: hypothetical protein VM409_03460 [Chloroflexia bacterium]|nr:hypothetical protein [Chloroflexia bacterium]
MPKQAKEPTSNSQYNDLEYEGEPPSPDLIDYRHMTIAMEKWAVTDSGCLSVVVCLGFFFACFVVFFAYSRFMGY